MRPPPRSSNSSGSKNSTDNDPDLDEDNDRNHPRLTGAARHSRPRGRPSGSKNRPKPPVVVTRESPTALRSNIIEISPSTDIADALTALARRNQRGISVFSGTGTLASVSLRQPDGTVLSFAGEFQILCLSGAFLPPPSPDEASGLTVFLAAGNGQIVGGRVASEVITASTVTIIAATFANAKLERLPLVSDDVAAEQQHGSDKREGDQDQSEQHQELDLWQSQILNEPIN